MVDRTTSALRSGATRFSGSQPFGRRNLTFDIYMDRVRMAVERKVALSASTHIELDIMNTAGSSGIRIVGEESRASRVLLDWVTFARSLERKGGFSIALSILRHR